MANHEPQEPLTEDAVEEVDPETSLEESEDTFESETDEDTADAKESDEETTEDESEETETEESTEESEAEETEESQSDEDKQKAHNREMAQKRIQDKAKREADLKQQQQDYIAAAEKDNPSDAAIRQLQVDAYNNKVDANTSKLTNGYERAIKDFDILRDPSPEIQAEVDAALDAFQALAVSLDQFGNLIEVRQDLYSYLKSKADSIQRLTGLGSRTQVKSKQKERSKTIARPSREPKKPKVDPDVEAFDEEASRW